MHIPSEPSSILRRSRSSLLNDRIVHGLRNSLGLRDTMVGSGLSCSGDAVVQIAAFDDFVLCRLARLDQR